MEMLNEIIVILSLSLTTTYLFMCVEIPVLWVPSIKKSAGAAKKLAKGIVYGFSSSFLDNLYWACAWYLVLIDHPKGMTLMFWGSLANIFLRQGGGILAAQEHLNAANMLHKDKTPSRLRLYWLAGVFTFFFLLYVKYG